MWFALLTGDGLTVQAVKEIVQPPVLEQQRRKYGARLVELVGEPHVKAGDPASALSEPAVPEPAAPPKNYRIRKAKGDD